MKIKSLITKYKELIMYVVFGVLTTAVNFVAYAVLARILGIDPVVSSAIANVISILFAYVTNRIWVFNSKVKGFAPIFFEMVKFFGGRAFSAVLDILFIHITVSLLSCNDLLMKLISNVVVIIVNYVISKLFVFKKAKKQG